MSHAPSVAAAARSLRPPAPREFPLVRRQHPDHGDGGPDPGGGRRLADVRAHARSAGARDGRPGRGGAVHRLRALRRARRGRPRPPAGRARRRCRSCCRLRRRRWPRRASAGRARGRPSGAWIRSASTRSSSSAGRRAASCCRRATRSAPIWCPRPLFPSAVAWRTGIWQVAAVTGPALGGLFYAWVGATASYAIAAALMAISLVTVARIDAPARPRRRGPSRWWPASASRAGVPLLAARSSSAR